MAVRKILVTTSSFPADERGTDGIFVEELAKRLANDFDIYVLAPYSHNSQKEETKFQLKIRRYKYWPSKRLLCDGEIMANLKKHKWMYLQILPLLICQLIAVKKLIRQYGIDTIHAHWLIPQALVAVLIQKFVNRKVNVLVTIHGGDINVFDCYWGRKLLRFVLNNIDTLTVVSDAIKNKVVDIGYKREIFVCPMGVDTRLFSPEKKDPAIRTKHNITGSFVLFVGGLNHRKGIGHLINALPAILKQHPETKLMVVGKGILEKQMRDLCKKLQIEQNVIFTGLIPHDNLPPYFATADVFVLPSFSEGWPVVVMEALSSETPSVVTNLPVFTEHPKKEKLFNVVEAGNAESIATGIAKLISDKDINQHKKKYLREFAINHLDWEAVAKNYAELLFQ